MNEKFFALPQEKQIRIVKASMEVFGKRDYRHAITDEIAYKAGISKGLLFHYVGNKKQLYYYTYQFCIALIKDCISLEEVLKIDDFFGIMRYGAQKKMEIIQQYPYLMEFAVKCFYSKSEVISEEINEDLHVQLKQTYEVYFTHVNPDKFREGIEPYEVYCMLQWMTDGYMHSLQDRKKKVDVEELLKQFYRWETMLKPMIYKEEFL